jgi:hypothetical protein
MAPYPFWDELTTFILRLQATAFPPLVTRHTMKSAVYANPVPFSWDGPPGRCRLRILPGSLGRPEDEVRKKSEYRLEKGLLLQSVPLLLINKEVSPPRGKQRDG